MYNMKEIENKYKQLFENPKSCSPLVVVDYPVPLKHSWGEMVRNKEKMLETQLETIEQRRKLGDDWLPTLRINFGTGQLAAAFGCDLIVLEDSLPACKNHVLKDIEKMQEQLAKPTMTSYWNEKVLEFQEYFMQNKPEEYPLQHPDVQSAFNSAHLIRGNDIFLDFYDEPELTKELILKVNEFMKTWITATKAEITKAEDGWFYDAAGLWKGGARISNCSMEMISPAQYREFVRAADYDFMEFLGGGRVHYCGHHGEIIKDFVENPNVTSMEIDLQYHRINDINDKVVTNDVVIKYCDWTVEGTKTDWLEHFEKNGMTQKRNFVVSAKADNEEDAKRLLEKLQKLTQRT